jgi:hypothetical protein
MAEPRVPRDALSAATDAVAAVITVDPALTRRIAKAAVVAAMPALAKAYRREAARHILALHALQQNHKG